MKLKLAVIALKQPQNVEFLVHLSNCFKRPFITIQTLIVTLCYASECNIFKMFTALEEWPK